jgi:GNAT superfamily N-acetyltransferase
MSGAPANRPAPSYTIDPRGIVTWRRDGYEISTDRARIDLDVVHGFLVRSYWCANVTREHVARSIEHSIPLGLHAPDGPMAGFARLVTDRATFAWMSDVFVLEAHRGRGLGHWLSACAVEHPDVATVRNFVLATRDAQPIYATVGFEPLPDPRRFMRRRGVDYGPGRGYGDRAEDLERGA